MKSESSIDDQAKFLLCGLEVGLYNAADIYPWVESVVDSHEKPPPWIIELYTLNPTHSQDFERLFREYVRSTEQTTTDLELKCCAHVYFSGKKSLQEVLRVVFYILIIDPAQKTQPMHDPESVEQMKALLVEWDTDLKLNIDLTQRIEKVLKKFQERESR
jgi:hypothetical protein